MTETTLICMGLLAISEALQPNDGEGYLDSHKDFYSALEDFMRAEEDDDPTGGVEDLQEVVETLQIARKLLLRANPQIADRLNQLANTLAENLEDDEPTTYSSGTVPKLHRGS